MTHNYILSLADPNATLANVGGKGASLARLANAGLPVPDGFHVTTAAYQTFVAANDLQPEILAVLQQVDASQPTTFETASRAICDLFANAPLPRDIAEAIATWYLKLPGAHPTVAVRSSATAEDLPDLSFAGQQETFLNIEGAVAVQDAVHRCWASLWTPRAIGYRAQHKIAHDAVALAVVVQVLVHADAAGILFTANPVNGARDQVVINAAWGLGEAIVGGRVTPDTVIVDKASGHVIERETADKETMTVCVDHGTEERPTPDKLRRTSVLGDEQAAELARLGVLIENLYRMPMDIEWALAQNQFAILQARPITALPEPVVTPPMEWKLPDPKGKYLRASIVDLMPDPVSPLFATMGLGALGAGMNRAMSELTKSNAALPHDYIVTINDYAFQNAKMDGRMAWWLLTRMVPSMPRMLRSGLRLWREKVYPRYVDVVRRWENQSYAGLSSTELLNGAREITDAAMYNLAWQLSWMGASAGSEGLFTRVYDKLVKRDGDPAATAFVMGYDSTPIRAEKSLYDLATWSRDHEEIATYIQDTPSDQLAAQFAQEDARTGDWQEFQRRFRNHLRDFGHLIYDLDFAEPLPLDDPVPMLETIKMYLRGKGVNPHERQQTLETKRVQAVENALRRIKGLRRWAFTKALNWAQSLAQAREDGIAAIGLGYPLVRQLMRELGRRLIDANVIEQPDDIFWLRENELEQAVAILTRGESPVSMAERIQERRNFSRAVKRVTPPSVLPPSKRVWGINVESFTAADESSQTASTLKGAGTSAGRVTAPARVLRGPEDFDQMKPGEVLVAGITTPAWTPLFAMASGVVTDIGGPLSHGSIVAREYGIPAVMGTGVATKRIHNGDVITVDGSAGRVTLPQN